MGARSSRDNASARLPEGPGRPIAGRGQDQAMMVPSVGPPPGGGSRWPTTSASPISTATDRHSDRPTALDRSVSPVAGVRRFGLAGQASTSATSASPQCLELPTAGRRWFSRCSRGGRRPRRRRPNHPSRNGHSCRPGYRLACTSPAGGRARRPSPAGLEQHRLDLGHRGNSLPLRRRPPDRRRLSVSRVRNRAHRIG